MHEHNHEHETHAPIQDREELTYAEKLSYYERWIIAMKALMIEKGILTAEEIDRKMGVAQARTLAMR